MKLTALFAALGLLILTGCGVLSEAEQRTGEASSDLREQTAQQLTEQRSSSGQEPEQDQELTGKREPDVAVAASCAAGTPQVDLVAKGTVEEVVVYEDSSLVEVRVNQVLKGNAEDKIMIQTRTGTQVATSVDVQFEEGVRYLFRLNRQSEVYKTNICLGTQALPTTAQEVEGRTDLAKGH